MCSEPSALSSFFNSAFTRSHNILFTNARDVVGLLRYLNAPTFKYQFSIESTPIDELVGLSITHHNLLKILERLKDREREITVDLENPYRISNL